MKSEHSRNRVVDTIRGIAMLLVVAGHTITNSYLTNVENSLSFKIIWALQMPLFMLISGYVTFYSNPIKSARELVQYGGKKSMAYLFPWCIWTIIVRGFLLGGWTIHSFSNNIINLLWNMDSGYWFLTSLWTIQILWGISSYICRRAFSAHALCKVVLTSCISLVMSVFLLVLGYFVGFSFLGIKLTCYYLPFFLLGCIFPYLIASLNGTSGYRLIERVMVCASAMIFLFLVISRNFYTAVDTIKNVLERVVCSLCGCGVLVYTIYRLNGKLPERLKTALV